MHKLLTPQLFTYQLSTAPNYYLPLAEPANPDKPTLHAPTKAPQCTQPPAEPSTQSPTGRPPKHVRWKRALATTATRKHEPVSATKQQPSTILRRKELALTLANFQEICRNNRRTRTAAAILDSGATGHFGSSKGEMIVLPEPSARVVQLANGHPIMATNKALLPHPTLSTEARKGDILPGLQRDLISVGTLADNGYTTIFHPGNTGATVHATRDVTIIEHTPPVLQGCRDTTGLWTATGQRHTTATTGTTTPTADHANLVYELPSMAQAIRFHHASLGYPTKDTLVKAINNGHFVGWPLLTARSVVKHFPDSDATIAGHTNQQRQGVRSTHPTPTPAAEVDPTSAVNRREHDIYPAVYELRHTVHSDQTGRFPIASRAGYQYIMVLVEVDSNYVFVEPMKNRTDSEMQRAYLKIRTRLTQAGITVRKHILDNEVSAAMKELITETCHYELVPPGCHRRNLAEVSIKHFKQHMISILAGIDPAFPLSHWEKLLPQAELTFNLLRKSHATPTISAYAHVHGQYDYNKMPLAPIGCAVHIHEQAAKRATWAPHTIAGWYLGPSREHYRCHVVLPKQTQRTRVCETVVFKHKTITSPTLSPADHVVAAAGELTNALKGYTDDDNAQYQELIRLAGIFEEMGKQKQQGARHQPPATLTPSTVPDFIMSPPSPGATPLIPPLPPVIAAGPDTPPPPAPQPPLEPKRLRRELKALGHTAELQRRDRTKRAEAAAAAQDHALTLDDWTHIVAPTVYSTTQKTLRFQAPHSTLTNLAYAVLDTDTGEMLNYRQLLNSPKHRDVWTLSSADEFGRLAQGVGTRIKGTDTIKFIPRSMVPQERMCDVTYGKFVWDYRPQKESPFRTRLTVGGDRVNYPGDVGTPTADLLLAKIMFNSVVSTKNAKFMTLDIGNFYLNTPLKRYEYVRLKLTDIPEEIIVQYNLRAMATPDGYVYIEISKGMYGLPQAGLLAQQLLEERLNQQGYMQDKMVPGLWKHTSRPISFTLCVDDFGVKYVGREHAEHLIEVLQKHYKLTIDWTGSKYIGLDLAWDYDKREVHLSMPGYVAKALKRFDHPTPTKRQDQPHPHIPPKYGATTQYATAIDTTPLLDKAGQKFIQQVNGTLLYLARAVDATILPALSSLAAQQAAPTETTLKRAKQLLDYMATQDDAVLTYRASDMILAVHSDAGYLNEPKARSRAGGIFFLTSGDNFPPPNGAILNIAQIIKNVMTSAAEAELAALYINAKEAVYIRLILECMGHRQPPTPIQTDNSTAEGVINSTVQPKRTKAMDMRFHWLRDRETLQQFRFYWRPGQTNLADYWTKHHPAAHHRNMRPEFLTPKATLDTFLAKLATDRTTRGLLQGCASPSRLGTQSQESRV